MLMRRSILKVKDILFIDQLVKNDIKIKSGAFLGLEGLFDRYKKGGDRVVILFNLLNKMTRLNLSIEQVNKVV